MAYRRLPAGEGGLLYLFRQYSKDARRRGYDWNLELGYFREVITAPCFFCGDDRPQVARKGHGAFSYTGIDRFDNTVGYFPGNAVSCCGRCNKMKGTLHGEDFLEHVQRIARRPH